MLILSIWQEKNKFSFHYRHFINQYKKHLEGLTCYEKVLHGIYALKVLF